MKITKLAVFITLFSIIFLLGFGVVNAQTTPTITVTSALSGSIITLGNQLTNQFTVNWTGGTPTVNINLWQNGVYLKSIASSIPNTGTFSWTLQTPYSVTGSGFQIQVASVGASPGYVGFSETLNIVSPQTTTQPSITITSPNGGETLTNGQSAIIQWSSQNIPSASTVTISLLHGTTNSRRNQFVNVPNTGSISWTVNSPEALDNTYKILIEANCNTNGTNCAASGQSDSAFSITAATPVLQMPTITNITPNQGTSNTAVTIYGTNLYGTDSVEFYNSSGQIVASIPKTNLSSVTNSSVSFTMPQSFSGMVGPGTYQIGVVTNACAGGCDSNRLSFSFISSQTQSSSLDSIWVSPSSVVPNQITTIGFSGTNLSYVKAVANCPVSVTSASKAWDICNQNFQFSPGANTGSTQLQFNNTSGSAQQVTITAYGYDSSNSLMGTKSVYVTIAPASTANTSTQGVFSFSKDSFSATYVQGATLPTAATGAANYFSNTPYYQSLTFTNTSNVPITYLLSIPNQPAWLNTSFGNKDNYVTVNPGQSNSLIPYLDPTTLANSPGTYTTNLIISGNFVGSPKVIPATLTVTPSTTSSTITPTIYYINPTSAKIGDTVTIYGSNLYGDTVLWDSGILSSYVTNYGFPNTSGNIMTFTVPSTATVGSHTIQINQKITGGNSNSATLNVVSSANTSTSNHLAYITNVKYSPAYPKVNDPVTAYVTVTNNFSTDQTVPFKVNVQGTTVTVPYLAARAQITVTVPNAFSFSYPGTQTLVNSLIDNQGNDFSAYTNTLTFSSTSQDPNQPTFSGSQSYINSGSDITFTWNVPKQFSQPLFTIGPCSSGVSMYEDSKVTNGAQFLCGDLSRTIQLSGSEVIKFINPNTYPVQMTAQLDFGANAPLTYNFTIGGASATQPIVCPAWGCNGPTTPITTPVTTPTNIQALQQQLTQLITLLIQLIQSASSQGLISSTQLQSALNGISH